MLPRPPSSPIALCSPLESEWLRDHTLADMALLGWRDTGLEADLQQEKRRLGIGLELKPGAEGNRTILRDLTMSTQGRNEDREQKHLGIKRKSQGMNEGFATKKNYKAANRRASIVETELMVMEMDRIREEMNIGVSKQLGVIKKEKERSLMEESISECKIRKRSIRKPSKLKLNID